jgi:hypothetical protein
MATVKLSRILDVVQVKNKKLMEKMVFSWWKLETERVGSTKSFLSSRDSLVISTDQCCLKNRISDSHSTGNLTRLGGIYI